MARKILWLTIIVAALVLPSVLWEVSLHASDKLKVLKEIDPVSLPNDQTHYRSPSDRHKIEITDPELARQLLAKGDRLVGDYGAFKIFEVSDKEAERLREKKQGVYRDEYNLVMLNTGAIDTTTDQSDRLKAAEARGRGKGMRLVQFPGPIKPEWYDALAATGVEIITYVPNNAYLVYGDSSSLARIRRMAGKEGLLQWEGSYQESFKLDPALAVSQKSEKGELSAQSKDEKGRKDVDTGIYAIQLVNDPQQNRETLALIERFKTEPIRNDWRILKYHNLIVGLSPDTLTELAKRPDVIYIAPYLEPVKFDERQNQIIAGNLTGSAPTPGDWLAYLAGRGFTQAQFTASGFAVDVGDDGLDNATITPNHPGLYVEGLTANPSRVVYARKEGTGSGPEIRGCDGHGTLNTHIVGGFVPFAFGSGFPHADSEGFRYGMGVAPFVRVGSSVVFSPGFTSPNFPNWQSRAYNDGARISTNSWGASVGGAYTIDAQTFDALVRDAQPAAAAIPAAGNQEMVILFAAGNDGAGAQTVGAPGTAKNVITVGAAENVHSHSTANGGNNVAGNDGCGLPDTGADNANDIIGFSSRGPCTDGRRKPEIVAPGTHVTGGVFQASGVLPVNGMADACFDSGSVCALPGSGTAGDPDNFFPLGQQWYTTSSGTSHSTPAVAGVAALIRQHFINEGLAPPSPAMTKATMMNSARYLTGVGANDNLWSNSQGMGEAHLNSFFDIFDIPSILREQSLADTFTASGQQRVVAGVVSDNTQPFRVTVVWTDTPGPTAGNAFVNNLDLEVTVGGQTFLGNVFTGAFSSTGGTADIRNNAESVFVPAGVSGTFIVTVRATNIAGDGVPNSGGPLDQDFALVIFNGEETPVAVIQADGSMITAESCSPATGAIDPNETVTVDFALRNVGTLDTTNLVATLQATGGVTAPSGPQNYGALTAGGAAVSRPFTFTADAMCGDILTATLQLQDGATDLGTVTFTFQVGATGNSILTNISSGGLTTAIPDSGSVDVPLMVSDVGLVTDVNVSVRLNHTFDGDLIISLIAPDGTTAILSNRRGGAGDNFGAGATDCTGIFTVFDDAASTAIAAGAPPFAGSFRPDEPLSIFNGTRTDGTWILRVSDNAALDTGTIFCWELEFQRAQFVCCGVAGTPVIVEAGSTITAEDENCQNDAIDPGETVTVELALSNVGTGFTEDVVATLQASGGITPITTSQSYGMISPIGPPVSRPFTFRAEGECGEMVTATLQLQDGMTDLGTVDFMFQLGADVDTPFGPFTNAASIAIPGTGTSGPAAPYPSAIAVAGVTGTVSKVTVTLTNMNHTFPDDIDILLVGPGGQNVILMSDVGGSNDLVNVTLTLDDDAADALSDSGQLVSGTFRPTNIGAGDAFPVPAPAGPHGATLSVFNGADPNGTWNLFVVDDVGGDTGNIAGGWTINIITTEAVCETGCGACVLTIECPSGVTGVTSTTGGATGIVTYDSPTVGGDCVDPEVICTPPSGSMFPAGVTTVTCTATHPSALEPAVCSFTVNVFDVCLQDDSNPNIVLLFNSATRQFIFCCPAVGPAPVTGIGTVSRKGNTISISANIPGFRLNATVSVNKGEATLRSGSTIRCSIRDTNTTNNTCSCAAAPPPMQPTARKR